MMIKVYWKWCYYLLFFLMSVTTALGPVSCNKYDVNWDYTEYVLQEEDIRLSGTGHALFSFEYPQCFHLMEPYGYRDWQTTRISFTKEGIGRFSTQNFLRLAIRVYPPGVEGNTDALTTIEKIVTDLSNSKYVENAQIINISSITVDTIMGEYIHYSYRDPPPQETNPYEQIVKEAWFDYSGFVWQIYFIYGPEYDEKDTEEIGEIFDHIIDTFKILD